MFKRDSSKHASSKHPTSGLHRVSRAGRVNSVPTLMTRVHARMRKKVPGASPVPAPAATASPSPTKAKPAAQESATPSPQLRPSLASLLGAFASTYTH